MREEDAIARIVQLVRGRYEHTYATRRPALRAQHAKPHGCVHARFVVGDVPADLRHGIFARPGAYDAIIRFSASFPTIRSDRWRDAHGMAIKVYLPQRSPQDFILANSPVFFVRNAVDYLELLQSGALRFLLRRPHELRNLLRATLRKVDNPLQARYWSQTPFLCGTHAVKYCGSWHSIPTVTTHKSRDALHDALGASLANRAACCDFQIQRQAGPIDDPTIPWPEYVAPFQTVAQLFIPAQTPSTGEALTFSPSHCLPEHGPLGAINRTRVAVYDTISTLRLAYNDESPA
jgi:hypothetical protein